MEDTHALNITHTSTEESRFVSDRVHHSSTNNSLVLKQDFEGLEGTNIDIHHIQLTQRDAYNDKSTSTFT
jgi:hypothetical protein